MYQSHTHHTEEYGLQAKDRCCQPHHRADLGAGITISLYCPMSSTELGFGYPNKVDEKVQLSKKN